MLTPQEVAEHAFQKASFGGYNMAMVDEFLDQVTTDYTTLYKENAALKAKMKILADKVEEYRSTEDSMRKTMLVAQKTADQIMADAEAQRSSIVHDAEEEAQEKIQAIRQEVANEQARLAAAQSATSSYIVKLKELYQHEMEYIGSLSKLVAAARQADPVAATAEAIGSAVEKAIEEDIEIPQEPAAAAFDPVLIEDNEPTLPRGPLYPRDEEEEDEEDDRETRRIPVASTSDDEEDDEESPLPPLRRFADDEDDEDEDDEPTRRIDFNNLKFGKDYEID
ncbi:MAG: DivIVA domain-containing protein [Oscillospiraceae bacterium]|nr:DivIVA domain-containing protein [Oscillospiraceae bacterium]